MTVWNTDIDLKLDVDSRSEPVLDYGRDAVLKRSVCHPFIQGSTPNVKLSLFKKIDGEYQQIEAPEECTVEFTCTTVHGVDAVAFSSDFAVDNDGVFCGTLNLNTVELDDAINCYPKVDCYVNINVLSYSTSLYQFEFRVEILRSTSPSSPIHTETNDYYTTDEADDYFARKDGPTGYGVKLVEVDGQMWAQLVGSAWVVNKIVVIDGQYYSQFVEVE